MRHMVRFEAMGADQCREVSKGEWVLAMRDQRPDTFSSAQVARVLELVKSAVPSLSHLEAAEWIQAPAGDGRLFGGGVPENLAYMEMEEDPVRKWWMNKDGGIELDTYLDSAQSHRLEVEGLAPWTDGFFFDVRVSQDDYYFVKTFVKSRLAYWVCDGWPALEGVLLQVLSRTGTPPGDTR